METKPTTPRHVLIERLINTQLKLRVIVPEGMPTSVVPEWNTEGTECFIFDSATHVLCCPEHGYAASLISALDKARSDFPPLLIYSFHGDEVRCNALVHDILPNEVKEAIAAYITLKPSLHKATFKLVEQIELASSRVLRTSSAVVDIDTARCQEDWNEKMAAAQQCCLFVNKWFSDYIGTLAAGVAASTRMQKG